MLIILQKQGFLKIWKLYTGNGNADGTFVYTGFKPAWVMIKKQMAYQPIARYP